MKKYLEKYPNEFINIMALENFLGIDEVEKICKRALLEYKMIKVIDDPKRLDYLSYELIS